MTPGSVVSQTPMPATGAPSAAAVVIGTPSPLAPSITGQQPVGNSSDFSTSFTDFIDGLGKSVVNAATGIGNSIQYKADKVLGTVQKGYYQTTSAFYGAVADTAQGAQNIASKVTTTSSLLVFAIIAFIAFPYIIAFSRKK